MPEDAHGGVRACPVTIQTNGSAMSYGAGPAPVNVAVTDSPLSRAA